MPVTLIKADNRLVKVRVLVYNLNINMSALPLLRRNQTGGVELSYSSSSFIWIGKRIL